MDTSEDIHPADRAMAIALEGLRISNEEVERLRKGLQEIADSTGSGPTAAGALRQRAREILEGK